MANVNFITASMGEHNVLTLQYSRLGAKEAEPQIEKISLQVGTRHPGLDRAKQFAQLIYPILGIFASF